MADSEEDKQAKNKKEQDPGFHGSVGVKGGTGVHRDPELASDLQPVRTQVDTTPQVRGEGALSATMPVRVNGHRTDTTVAVGVQGGNTQAIARDPGDGVSSGSAHVELRDGLGMESVRVYGTLQEGAFDSNHDSVGAGGGIELRTKEAEIGDSGVRVGVNGGYRQDVTITDDYTGAATGRGPALTETTDKTQQFRAEVTVATDTVDGSFGGVMTRREHEMLIVDDMREYGRGLATDGYRDDPQLTASLGVNPTESTRIQARGYVAPVQGVANPLLGPEELPNRAYLDVRQGIITPGLTVGGSGMVSEQAQKGVATVSYESAAPGFSFFFQAEGGVVHYNNPPPSGLNPEGPGTKPTFNIGLGGRF